MWWGIRHNAQPNYGAARNTRFYTAIFFGHGIISVTRNVGPGGGAALLQSHFQIVISSPPAYSVVKLSVQQCDVKVQASKLTQVPAWKIR